MQGNCVWQDGCYWICAKIEGVECNFAWYDMACKKCSKKVVKVSGRFFCGRCNKYGGTATQR